MGSGASRGKRVAPARLSEAHEAETAARKSGPSNRPLKPPKIHAVWRISARHRAQPERRGEGRESDCSSRDDDDRVDRDARTAAPDEQERSWACAEQNPSNQEEKEDKKKSSSSSRRRRRCKSYGLCRSRQEDEESGAEEPRGSRDVNKLDGDASQHAGRRAAAAAPSDQLGSPPRAFVTRDVVPEAVRTAERKPTSSKWQNPSFTPVILYDGSEEELMDTIEREFS